MLWLAACAQPSVSLEPLPQSPAAPTVPSTGAFKPAAMSFFVTSTNPGQGGHLGGLTGADSHCQFLATTAGAGQRTWRAYLSSRGTLGGFLCMSATA